MARMESVLPSDPKVNWTNIAISKITDIMLKNNCKPSKALDIYCRNMEFRSKPVPSWLKYRLMGKLGIKPTIIRKRS